MYSWFEDGAAEPGQITGEYQLKEGSIAKDKLGRVTDKACSQPSDRPKLLFLERQSRLLGKTE